MSASLRWSRTRLVLASAAVGFLAAGCADDPSASSPVAAPLETAALGVVPDPPTPLEPPAPPPAPSSTTDVTTPEIEPIEGPIGAVVEGNRLLLIGDTAMATLTERQEGTACPALPDLGWQVRIEAEVGRFVSFADEVIERVVVDSGEEWDAVGLMFGLHVDTPPAEFRQVANEVIDRLDGRPVIVYTVPERTDPEAEPNELAVELNEHIRSLPSQYPNVVIIDWADEVNTDADTALVDDDRVPTADGTDRLVLLTADALGPFPPAPAASDAGDTTAPATTTAPAGGECLEAFYTDDSAILL